MPDVKLCDLRKWACTSWLQEVQECRIQALNCRRRLRTPILQGMTLNPNYARVPLMTRQPHVPVFDSPEFKRAVEFFHTPHVTIDDEARTQFKDVYFKYVDWCETQGIDRVSWIYFSWAIINNGIVHDTRSSGRRRHIGVRINHLEIPAR